MTLSAALDRFGRHRTLRAGILLTMMAAAFGLRVYNLEAPGILPEREFHSLTIARVGYFAGEESIPAWRREMASIQRQKLWNLEPPLLEFAVAKAYDAIGREDVAVPRILNAALWVAGAVVIYEMGVTLAAPLAGVIATAYYLFVPLGVLVSRSFQPESLMVLLLLISLLAILRFSDRQTWPRLLAAACASALTLVVKPLPASTILCAFVALNGRRDWRVLDARGWTFVALALAPAAVYYGYGIFWSRDLRPYVQMGFRPELLVHREFWDGWLLTATSVVGPMALVGGLIGIAFAGGGTPRRFLAGLWVGYACFGLLFTHHIHTHTYYSLPLVIITALALGLLMTTMRPVLVPRFHRWYSGPPVALALLVISFFVVQDVKRGLRAPHFESPETAEQVGELVHHSRRVVHISRHYGQPLEYFGELAGSEWPKAVEYWLYRRPGEHPLSIKERVNQLGFEPEYLVVTDLESFKTRHADMKSFVEARCRLIAQSENYLIYDASCTREID